MISCSVSEILAPTNGHVTHNEGTVIFSCDTGYELFGSTNRTCNMSSGVWSSANTTCSGEFKVVSHPKFVTGSGKRAHLAQVINFQFIALSERAYFVLSNGL